MTDEQNDRPDWVKCIGDGCGLYDWRFVDLDHALTTMENEERLTPCPHCLRREIERLRAELEREKAILQRVHTWMQAQPSLFGGSDD